MIDGRERDISNGYHLARLGYAGLKAPYDVCTRMNISIAKIKQGCEV